MKKVTASVISFLFLTGCSNATAPTNVQNVSQPTIVTEQHFQSRNSNNISSQVNTNQQIPNRTNNLKQTQVSNTTKPNVNSTIATNSNNKVINNVQNTIQNKVIINENYNTTTLLAGLKSSSDKAKVNEIAKKYNLTVNKILNGINTVVFHTNGQDVKKLLPQISNEAIFSYVETDAISSNKPEKETDIVDSLFSLFSTDEVNDKYFSKQYGLPATNTPLAWDITKGENVIVSVIDSGVDVDHQDLKNQVVPGYDAFSQKEGTKAGDASSLNYISGTYKHGSHVAGIISAEANNSKGIAGVAPGSKIMPVKIFPDFTDFFKPAKKTEDGSDVTVVSAIADGIVWSADHNADVINMSLAVWEPSNTIQRAVEYALEKNVILVVAAGNERHIGNKKNYLAAYSGVIGVGATDDNNKLAYFSNSGDYVSVVAPGYDIISSVPSFLNIKLYKKMSGTSMAAPHVAGIAALLRSKFGKEVATPAWVKSRLESTSTDLGVEGRDDFYGHGLVNALKALNEPV